MKPGGGVSFDAPQEVVRALLALGRLEGLEHALRIDRPITCRTIPPLPAESIACSTSSTEGEPSTTRDCA
jgi:hypothetical protein